MGNTPDLTSIQDSRAPWNEEENEDKRFDCTVVQTLSREHHFHTNNYEMVDGDIIHESIHAKDDYTEQHYTPLELINMLKRLLEDLRAKGSIQWNEYQEEIINDCEGWEEDDLDVTIED